MPSVPQQQNRYLIQRTTYLIARPVVQKSQAKHKGHK